MIDLITSLEQAQAAGRLTQRLAVLTHPSLLVVDEIGYLPINHMGAVLFFQLMSRRYEKASTVLTSNEDFEQWGEILGDYVIAAALIDSQRERRAARPPRRRQARVGDQPRDRRRAARATRHYGTLIDLIISLEQAQAAGRQQQRLAVLNHPS